MPGDPGMYRLPHRCRSRFRRWWLVGTLLANAPRAARECAPCWASRPRFFGRWGRCLGRRRRRIRPTSTRHRRFPVKKKMRTAQVGVKTSYQSGSNSPPGPYLAFIIIRYPSSLEETDVRTHERCIQAKTHCWMLRRSSRSLPTSPRSIRTSVASALLNSSRY